MFCASCVSTIKAMRRSATRAQIIDILDGQLEAEANQLRSQGAARALAILDGRIDVLSDLADMLFQSMALDAAALKSFARRALS
jgi:hypothetical protein